MRGSVVRRGKNRYALVFTVTDKEGKRKQKWVTFHGNAKKAGEKLTELVGSVHGDTFVEPTKLTLADWLATWHETIVTPANRPNTVKSYKSIVGQLTRALGPIPLQKLTPANLEHYSADKKHLKPATLRLHHTVIDGALQSAVKKSLVTRNVAKLVEGLPKIEHTPDERASNVLNLNEAKRLLAAAKLAGSRQSAFYALALDSGARLGELSGLQWTDFDLDAAKLTIVRQLISAKRGAVAFGPTKTGKARTIDLSAETLRLLKTHKTSQAALKLKSGSAYHDAGLVFTKESADLLHPDDVLGSPLQMTKIGAREFARLLKSAKVKKIGFHGLRHTSATLLLLAGVPAKVVSERLGHAKIAITLDTYSHVLPTMGRDAATQLGALLHG